MQYIVGIDEAGRGPIAGPVAVGIVKIPRHFTSLPPPMGATLKDSKKLSKKKREAIYEWIEHNEAIAWAVGMSTHATIDKRGIIFAIQSAMRSALKRVVQSDDALLIKLDGALHAPGEWRQETIIKGDEKELSIALASIVAKVTRDRYMEKAAKKYPQYGFEKHSGYGTKAHYSVIQKIGLSPLHRRSFCKR